MENCLNFKKIMKKIFLASQAWETMDKFIDFFQCIPWEMIVWFISTAGDVYRNKSFIEKDRNKLLELWFNVIDINIDWEKRESIEEKMKNINIIFVAWGNTFYLLEKVVSSGFDNIIREFIENWGYYIGSSAGSVIVWTDIELVKSIDNPDEANISNFEGIKLFDKMILPHYDKEWYQDKMNKIIQKYGNLKGWIVTLNDNQALAIKWNYTQMLFVDS